MNECVGSTGHRFIKSQICSCALAKTNRDINIKDVAKDFIKNNEHIDAPENEREVLIEFFKKIEENIKLISDRKNLDDCVGY
ncbi:MAG: hypothetical protein K0U19_00750 [Proteobacteria bacterium]|nr:hypothetical protein [Pseudomonadota bacterium]